MANTWTCNAQAVAYALNKDMIDVHHTAADARFERIREIVMLNNSLTAVVGVILQCQILRHTTAPTGGTAITPVSRDSSNAALNAGFTSGTGRTLEASSLYRQFVFGNEEPVIAGAAFANWLTLVPFGLVWPPSVGDTSLQPLTMVGSTLEGFYIKNITSTIVGAADLEAHITDEAT